MWNTPLHQLPRSLQGTTSQPQINKSNAKLWHHDLGKCILATLRIDLISTTELVHGKNTRMVLICRMCRRPQKQLLGSHPFPVFLPSNYLKIGVLYFKSWGDSIKVTLSAALPVPPHLLSTSVLNPSRQHLRCHIFSPFHYRKAAVTSNTCSLPCLERRGRITAGQKCSGLSAPHYLRESVSVM